MLLHTGGENHATVYESSRDTDDQSDKITLDKNDHNWGNSQDIKQASAVDITYGNMR